METGSQQPNATRKSFTDGDETVRECIDNCNKCGRVCLETVRYCLGKGGQHAEQTHILNLLSCAKICQTSADFMVGGSDLHIHTCEACAKVCHQCADDCATMSDDEVMNQCAEACRKCADSCERMSAV